MYLTGEKASVGLLVELEINILYIDGIFIRFAGIASLPDS